MGAQAALINGAVGMVWVVGERAKVVWDFTVEYGKIVNIELIAAPESVSDLDLTVLDD